MVNLRLEQKPELRQILTPKLIETLKLLILPKIELQKRLEQELMENPMLDAEDEEHWTESNEMNENLAEWKKLLDGIRITSRHLEEKDPDTETVDPLIFTPYQKTLYEDLQEQLAATVGDDRIQAIGEFIIGNLDNRGFLSIPVQEIVSDFVRSGELEPPPTEQEVMNALKIVQSLSPPGIAARDVRECMILQLKDLNLEDSIAYKIIDEHYDELLSKNIPQLAKSIGVDDKEIEKALEILSHLSFYPAEGRGITASFVEPDLIVYKDSKGKWKIIYNDENIPRLSINNRYKQLLQKVDNLNKEAKEYLLSKLESAKWWIDALNQRRINLENTMRAILEYQNEFFEKGPKYIKPLTMETIADAIEVHPATISRIVRDKYVLTPYGTFPMRNFFTTGLASKDGGEIATDRVKEKIKQMVENEDKHKPLSDQKIANKLQSDGIKIARRTVAKYRENMGILPARRRRR